MVSVDELKCHKCRYVTRSILTLKSHIAAHLRSSNKKTPTKSKKNQKETIVKKSIEKESNNDTNDKTFSFQNLSLDNDYYVPNSNSRQLIANNTWQNNNAFSNPYFWRYPNYYQNCGNNWSFHPYNQQYDPNNIWHNSNSFSNFQFRQHLFYNQNFYQGYQYPKVRNVNMQNFVDQGEVVPPNLWKKQRKDKW